MVMDYDNGLRACSLVSIRQSIAKAKRGAARVCKKHGSASAETYESISEVARLQAGFIERLENEAKTKEVRP
jgi:hypothetical protein